MFNNIKYKVLTPHNLNLIYSFNIYSVYITYPITTLIMMFQVLYIGLITVILHIYTKKITCGKFAQIFQLELY